jgi:hypothetical protein
MDVPLIGSNEARRLLTKASEASRLRKLLRERTFTIVYWTVTGLIITFAVWDFHQAPPNIDQTPKITTESTTPTSVTFNISAVAAADLPLRDWKWLFAILLVISSLCLALVVIEMATYKPRLFALSDSTVSSSRLFNELRLIAPEVRHVLAEIESVPPRSYSNLKQMEENLLVEANNFCRLDNLRMAITIRLLRSFVCVILALGLIAYSLSHIMNGRFVTGLGADPGVLRHTYFTIVTFFTIGFGDIKPYPNPISYAFVGLCAILLVTTTYFIVGFMISSHFDFQTNLRLAAHTYIVSLAKF